MLYWALGISRGRSDCRSSRVHRSSGGCSGNREAAFRDLPDLVPGFADHAFCARFDSSLTSRRIIER